MRYSLGLDIGIASVGWAVLNLDQKRIEDLGVRAFNAAEDPKTHAPLAEPRRLARGARRRLRRRAGRLRRAKDLFVQYGLIPGSRRDSAFETRPGIPSPWELRTAGLDRLLTGEEFARALFHIVKRRGFKSNRKKAPTESKEDGKMLGGIASNRRILEEGGYRTAGEMLCRDRKFEMRKRNTTDSYENTVDRELLEDEIRTLFARQRDLGSAHAKSEFEAALVEVFAWQRPYASGDDILKMVGTCTFETGELRAPKHSYHAERFNLLQKINSLTYTRDGDRLRLSDEQRAAVERLAYSRARVTYAQIRREIGLPDDARFTGLEYTRRSKETGQREESLGCEDRACVEMKGYHALRKACEAAGVWPQVESDPDLMDDLAFALTFYKTDEDIRSYLGERQTPEEIIEAALQCEQFAKTIHLSVKALKKVIPYLETGLVYSDACARAGYDHSAPGARGRGDRLPPIPPEVTRNPVVLRALTQARKVVNAVIARYGPPYAMRIEFARDMGKSAEKRKEIQNRQEENRAETERLREEFREAFGREPIKDDLLKWRLYREQGGKCAYSQRPLDIESLFEPGYAEVDHILPYSRSFDDSRSNKALVLASENRNKQDRTPYEAFGHDGARWRRFEDWVRAAVRDPKKRAKFLKTDFDERQEDEWKDRNLADTSIIAREFARFVRDNLAFADLGAKQPLVCVNGQITARVRRLWGLEKKREEDDLHHALDAAVIASLLPWQVKMITEHAKVEATGGRYVDTETGEIIERTAQERPRLPLPWKAFRKELLARLSDDPRQEIARLGLDPYKDVTDLRPVLVSRMPRRKMTGAIHEDTIRSATRLRSDGISVVRKPLTSLKKDDLDKLFAPETNEKLYAAIRERMEQFDWVAKKAFAEPLRKPTNDGSEGPIVRSVKVVQAQNMGVPVRGGIADNGSMVRVDVFAKAGKFYLVPVYVSDVMRGRLPDRAIAAHKPYEEWPVMDSTYDFRFSLYPYDFVRIRLKGRDVLGYYRTCDASSGSLTVGSPNKNEKEPPRFGARLAEAIEKFEMGILGDYHPVRREVRRGLEDAGNLKSGEAEDQE